MAHCCLWHWLTVKVDLLQELVLLIFLRHKPYMPSALLYWHLFYVNTPTYSAGVSMKYWAQARKTASISIKKTTFKVSCKTQKGA